MEIFRDSSVDKVNIDGPRVYNRPVIILNNAALADRPDKLHIQFGSFFRTTFTELCDSVCTANSKENNLYTVQNMEGIMGRNSQKRGGVRFF